MKLFHAELIEFFEELVTVEIEKVIIINKEELSGIKEELKAIELLIEKNLQILEELKKEEKNLEDVILKISKLLKPKEEVNFVISKEELIQQKKIYEKSIEVIKEKIEYYGSQSEQKIKIIEASRKIKIFLTDLSFCEKIELITKIIERISVETHLKRLQIEDYRYQQEIENLRNSWNKKQEEGNAFVFMSMFSFFSFKVLENLN